MIQMTRREPEPEHREVVRAPGLTLTNEEYHSSDAISSTQLKLMDESYAHFKHRDTFKYTTAAMDKGTLYHTMTLEPETFDKEFLEAPQNAKKNTTIGKQKWEDHEERLAGRITVTREEVENGAAMAHNAGIMINELLGVKDFKATGWPERSFIVYDPETGLQLRCRPDWLTHGGIFLDLKSIADVTEYGIKKAITEHEYVRQIAFYEKVLTLAGIHVKRAALVFTETGNGHMVKIRTFEDHLIDEARRDIDNMLHGYAEYIAGQKAAAIAKNATPWPKKED